MPDGLDPLLLSTIVEPLRFEGEINLFIEFFFVLSGLSSDFIDMIPTSSFYTIQMKSVDSNQIRMITGFYGKFDFKKRRYGLLYLVDSFFFFKRILIYLLDSCLTPYLPNLRCCLLDHDLPALPTSFRPA